MDAKVNVFFELAVGYGDMVPTTWQGKIIASFCALLGISFFALPAVSCRSEIFKQISGCTRGWSKTASI